MSDERICVCGVPMFTHPPREESILNSCWLSGPRMQQRAQSWYSQLVTEMFAVYMAARELRKGRKVSG